MNRIKVREAKGIIKTFMKLCGFLGWTSLWNTIYVMPGQRTNAVVMQHELIHIEQMQRDGKVLFVLKYIWWLCTKGYWNNPYEVEARTSSEGLKCH